MTTLLISSWNRFFKRELFLLVPATVLFCGVPWQTHAEGFDYYPPEPTATTTFESVGLYWTIGSHNGEADIQVRYREAGAEPWQEALPLWYDLRDGEARGSIVGLHPGTSYEIKLIWVAGNFGDNYEATLTAETWSEDVRVAKTIYLEPGNRHEPLIINEGGNPESGFVVYTVRPGEKLLIDVRDQHPYCVDIQASHVVVRGLILKGASRDGIHLGDVKDVMIEDCDVSNWGRRTENYAYNLDSAIKSMSSELERVVVQRNRLHHPRYNANDWTQPSDLPKIHGYHPTGAQGISWKDNQGNHVIRFNEIYSDSEHRFNDGMGWWTNFTRRGFPGPDSDIYGNFVSDCADDGIESEGGNRNVRIWGNYIENTYHGIGTAPVSVGPAYIFRNVYSVSYIAPYPGGDSDALVRYRNHNPRTNRGTFTKLGEMPRGGSGRQYWLHNTVLQPKPLPGKILPLGAIGAGRVGEISELVALNNIFHAVSGHSYAGTPQEDSNTVDYNLFNGPLPPGAEAKNIHATPRYAPGNGPEGGRHGMYQLAPDSRGRDEGKRLPNINDNSHGRAPDIGAHEGGSPRMVFGLGASEPKGD